VLGIAHRPPAELEWKLLYAETIETIVALMDEQGVSQRELARRLGRSEAWVSRMLNSRGNTTLKTIAELGWALGIRFSLAPRAAERADTPAANDPDPPDWLRRQARQAGKR